MSLTKEELDYWRARSLVIPIGWMRSESETARNINATSKGKVRFKDAFINYFEPIPEDDEDLYNQALEIINESKKNGDN